MTPVLLYDGTCGLCSGAVRFVLKHDPDGPLRFSPLDGAFAASWRERHPELAGLDSVVWVEPDTGRVQVRSDAALAVGRYLGGPWRALSAVARLVPRGLRDRIYDWVARNRYRVFGRHDGSCGFVGHRLVRTAEPTTDPTVGAATDPAANAA